MLRSGPTTEPSGHQSTQCQIAPRFRRLGEGFIVLAQATVAAEPGKGAFDDPATGQHLKSFRIGWWLLVLRHPDPTSSTPDDLKCPSLARRPTAQSWSLVTSIRPEIGQPGLMDNGAVEDDVRTVPVSDIGRMDDDLQDESLRIDEEVAFAATQTFAPVIAAQPPFSVVLTD